MPKNKTGVELPKTNVTLHGKDRDRNGNATIKLSFTNQKGFSIQYANNELRKTEEIMKWKNKGFVPTDEKDLKAISKEVVSYIKEHGTEKQKSRLRTY